MVSGLDAPGMEQIEPNGYGDIVETITFSKWRIERSGEIILWGEGTLHLDLVAGDNDRYELYEGENTTWDEYDRNAYVLLAEGAVDEDGGYEITPETVVGFALGELKRKMIPAASPDITAVEAEEFEDLEPIAPEHRPPADD